MPRQSEQRNHHLIFWPLSVLRAPIVKQGRGSYQRRYLCIRRTKGHKWVLEWWVLWWSRRYKIKACIDAKATSVLVWWWWTASEEAAVEGWQDDWRYTRWCTLKGTKGLGESFSLGLSPKFPVLCQFQSRDTPIRCVLRSVSPFVGPLVWHNANGMQDD